MELLEQAGWQFVNQLLQVAIPILVSLLVTWASQKVLQLGKRIKADKPSLHWALTEAGEMAVKSAEMLGGDGEEKLDYAVAFAQKLLDEQGIKIDVSTLTLAIESAVYDLKGKSTLASK